MQFSFGPSQSEADEAHTRLHFQEFQEQELIRSRGSYVEDFERIIGDPSKGVSMKRGSDAENVDS